MYGLRYGVQNYGLQLSDYGLRGVMYGYKLQSVSCRVCLLLPSTFCFYISTQMRLVSLGLDFGLLSKQSHFGLDAEAPALSDERLPSPPGAHHHG